MDRQIYRFLLLHSNLNLSDFLSFTLFKLVKIASFFIHRIELFYWILNSNISVYYNYKLSSFMFTANYCYWTIVQKWFTLIQDAIFIGLLIISILNQVLFIANIHISDPSIVSRLLRKLKEKQQSILKSNVLTTKATEASTIFSSPWFIRGLAGRFGILRTIWENIGTRVSLTVGPC